MISSCSNGLTTGGDGSLTVDPGNLRFLYQGVDPGETGVEYFQLPYQLALLTYTDTPPPVSNATTGGPSVCEDATVQADKDIADFDDGATSGWWDSYDDRAGASHEPMAAEPPGANDTSHALHFNGSGYADWGANFGTTPGCMDTSGFQGLSFYAKGSAGEANELHVMVQVAAALPASGGGDCVEDCYTHPRTTITLTDEWTRFDLPFDEFVHPGWGVHAEYEGVIMGFGFEPTGPDFDLWIDDVSLFLDVRASDAGVANADAGVAADASTSDPDGGSPAGIDSGTDD